MIWKIDLQVANKNDACLYQKIVIINLILIGCINLPRYMYMSDDTLILNKISNYVFSSYRLSKSGQKQIKWIVLD